MTEESYLLSLRRRSSFRTARSAMTRVSFRSATNVALSTSSTTVIIDEDVCPFEFRRGILHFVSSIWTTSLTDMAMERTRRRVLAALDPYVIGTAVTVYPGSVNR